MADDLLGGFVGDGDEQPKTEAPQALAGAEAFAAAITAIASRQDPGVARRTEAFLVEQTRLLETQRVHLEDEHAFRLSHLRLTVAAAKLKRYADHVRNWVYTGVALLVLGVLVAAVRMTVNAMGDHSLVVENFTVPSDFASRGITSQALADDLASRVAAIRVTLARDSLTQSGDVRADQASTLKVQIPETGISLDELERFLHRQLGHQTVVNGELREEAGGQVSVVLHVASSEPIVVSGSSADLDRLMQTAAERAFSIFNPGNSIIYLAVTGRPAEAYAAAQRYAHNAGSATMSSLERADAYTLLALVDPDTRRALSTALIATDIDAQLALGWLAAGRLSEILGHDEAAVDFYQRVLGTQRRDQPALQQDNYRWVVAEAHLVIAQETGNYKALQAAAEVGDQRPNIQLADIYAEDAEVAALRHDEARAQQALGDAFAAGSPDATVLKARLDVSISTGDWARALGAGKAIVAALQTQKAAMPNPEFAASTELVLATQYRPLLAYAEAMTGDVVSASTLIAQTPTDCYLCIRMRGRIAAAAGDAPAADRWFAEAIHQAPELPMGYYDWGQTLLARGDLVAAAQEFSLAHEKGPRFADALKGWGDVLAKQGQWKEALAKYDEAVTYAPKWAALSRARDVALKRSI